MDLTAPKPFFFDLDLNELQALLATWGEPNYRASQVWRGMYVELHPSPEHISVLPNSLKEKLLQHFRFSALTPAAVLKSKDNETVKTLFKLPDSHAIEAVLMHYDKRDTLCISTQAGCAMGCVFCATGQMGFKRNLTSGEIIEQVLYYARMLKIRGGKVTNIVLMGMGEPFHNYQATLNAVDRMNHPQGLNLGQRRFTISTVGLVPMIEQFANENRQINLAVSLHAADDATRSSMLPINKKYSIDHLIQACRSYTEKTHRRITFEWALINDVNDTPDQAIKLAQLLAGLLCHVNVIPLNPTLGYAGQATTRQRAAQFKTILEQHGIPCTVRIRRGIDIQAGCGQLAIKADL